MYIQHFNKKMQCRENFLHIYILVQCFVRYVWNDECRIYVCGGMIKFPYFFIFTLTFCVCVCAKGKINLCNMVWRETEQGKCVYYV